MTLLDKIDAYLNSKADYDAACDRKTEAESTKRACEYELVDEMLAGGHKSHGFKDDVHISLRKKYSCSVTRENERQIRAWLVETEGDDAQFVVEKVNKTALIEWLKSKNMEPDDAPAFLKLSTRPGITVRGWNT